jgi:hypothetical protein
VSSPKPSRALLRWVESRGSSDPLDARLSELFRRVDEPRELSSRELAEVRARLRPHALPRPLLLGRYAVLLAVGMLAGTGVAVAGYGVKRWVAVPAQVPAVSPPAPAVPPEEPRPVRARRSSLPQQAPSASVEPVTTEPVQKPVAAPVAPASSGVLGREAELLARALSKLRSEANPSAALALLDEYRREFPGGTLALESEVARLDAFLALARHDDALRLLDTLPIDRIGRGAELRVVRAELRARNEPATAVRDFNLALAASLSGPLEERALFGRAASRLRSGDKAGAEADLRRYLERHPHGRFAAEARAKLDSAE